jgi:hypothetical protein
MYQQYPDNLRNEKICNIIFKLDSELRVNCQPQTYALSPEVLVIVKFFANYIVGIEEELECCKNFIKRLP